MTQSWIRTFGTGDERITSSHGFNFRCDWRVVKSTLKMRWPLLPCNGNPTLLQRHTTAFFTLISLIVFEACFVYNLKNEYVFNWCVYPWIPCVLFNKEAWNRRETPLLSRPQKHVRHTCGLGEKDIQHSPAGNLFVFLRRRCLSWREDCWSYSEVVEQWINSEVQI